MNIQDILLIYEYNDWANKKILGASANVTPEQFSASASFPYGGLHGTLLHILDTEWGWRALFQKIEDASDLLPADYPTLSTIETRWQEEEAAMRAYLASLRDEDMESHLRYTTDTGIQRDRILWHCLLHVVNHGTQHRSEAAALLTDYGQSPGDLDFTVFLNDYRK
ncbi:MAG TPA: DinB family protein [Anaerolineales bacterium]|nr:DinB family protein [Anaerolineales bacterium]